MRVHDRTDLDAVGSRVPFVAFEVDPEIGRRLRRRLERRSDEDVVGGKRVEPGTGSRDDQAFAVEWGEVPLGALDEAAAGEVPADGAEHRQLVRSECLGSVAHEAGAYVPCSQEPK